MNFDYISLTDHSLLYCDSLQPLAIFHYVIRNSIQVLINYLKADLQVQLLCSDDKLGYVPSYII